METAILILGVIIIALAVRALVKGRSSTPSSGSGSVRDEGVNLRDK